MSRFPSWFKAVAFLVAVLVAALVARALPPLGGEPSLSQGQRSEAVDAIRDYLLEHPEFLIEVSQRLEANQKRQQAAKPSAAVAEYRQALYEAPASAVAGNPDGDVTIVEFFDYRCPYCKRSAPTLAALLDKDPGVRVIYKEFPILGPESVFASRAAIAARAQGGYVAFHLALMAAKGNLDERAVMRIAASSGLDLERLRRDMGAAEIGTLIEKNRKLARAVGVNGTPGFVIGNRVIAGYIDLARLQKVIAELRAE